MYGEGYLSEQEVIDHLVGRRVVHATETTLTLDNGVGLQFDTSNSDCCSFIELERLNTVPNIISSAKFESPDDDEGEYKAWIHVLTETGDEYKVAEADGNASNGYYLHGFALGVKLVEGTEPTDDEVQAAIESIVGF
jgi:hypothetical protein